MIFARTFLVIAWNLMCCASNAFASRHSHMEWSNDSLCIYFAHMKNDQGGERPRDPRHIYANPLSPEICPILPLSIYWATFQFVDSVDLLFPGGKQYDRFRKELIDFLDQPYIAEELRRRGVDPANIGSHSIRKGASTYCSSGSTSCPPSTAVHLRAGWSLGGVQNTYLRYESAGDMYVGRTVSGLPINSSNFSKLPPHFSHRTTEITDAINIVYPNRPPQLEFILEFALASLVYHYDKLCETLSPSHPLRWTPFFTCREIITSLKPLVICGHSSATSVISATGIPPHVSILSKLDDLKVAMCETTAALKVVSDSIVVGIEKALDDRAVMTSTVSYAGLREMITDCLRCLPQSIDIRADATSEQPRGLASDDPIPTTRLFMHDGLFSRLPPSFKVPNGTAYQLWML
ncbi:hypothetical protein Ae201684P_018849 [Aphanomyces euteiches]|nr:hypothetical protein Ae201684P_018849 [Aphanomyces euteiches]